MVHLAVTAHPTAAWVWRQLVEAPSRGRRLRHLVRDRDAVYGGGFIGRASGLGIETVLTPVRARGRTRSPSASCGTFRNEGLDHVIPLDERHLRTILAEYVAYDNAERPHRSSRP